jgi:hypothetical protein
MRRRILNTKPAVGSEADQSNTVSGSSVEVSSDQTCVPQRKQEWKYDQPKKEIKQTEVDWTRPV